MGDGRLADDVDAPMVSVEPHHSPPHTHAFKSFPDHPRENEKRGRGSPLSKATLSPTAPSGSRRPGPGLLSTPSQPCFMKYTILSTWLFEWMGLVGGVMFWAVDLFSSVPICFLCFGPPFAGGGIAESMALGC